MSHDEILEDHSWKKHKNAKVWWLGHMGVDKKDDTIPKPLSYSLPKRRELSPDLVPSEGYPLDNS